MMMWLLLIDVLGFVVIGLIVWWFWMHKAKAQQVSTSQPIEIIVEKGVYVPTRIEVQEGVDLTLRFIRKDPSPCAEKVLFEDWGLSVDLPLDEATDVVLPAPKSGEYSFTCQMQMYRGSLHVISGE